MAQDTQRVINRLEEQQAKYKYASNCTSSVVITGSYIWSLDHILILLYINIYVSEQYQSLYIP